MATPVPDRSAVSAESTNAPNSFWERFLSLFIDNKLVVGILAILLVFGGLAAIKFLNLSFTVDINVVTVLIVTYTVAWCYVAYFELYINRMNKNLYILLFSAVAALIFVTVLLLNP